MDEEIRHIEKLISKDKLEESLKVMNELLTPNDIKTKNDVLNLMARLAFLSKSYNLYNTISFKEFSLEISRIRIATINLKDYLKRGREKVDGESYDIIIDDESFDLPQFFKDKALLIRDTMKLNSKVKFDNCWVSFINVDVYLSNDAEILFENCFVRIFNSDIKGKNAIGKSLIFKNSEVYVEKSEFRNLKNLEIKNDLEGYKIGFYKCEFYDAFELITLENNSSDYITLDNCEFHNTPIFINSINAVIQRSEFYDHGIQAFIGNENSYLGIKNCEFRRGDNAIEVYVRSQKNSITIIGCEFNNFNNVIRAYMIKQEFEENQKFPTIKKNSKIRSQVSFNDTIFINSSEFYNCERQLYVTTDLDEEKPVQNNVQSSIAFIRRLLRPH